ncbi:hypothetical protein MHYP_G00027910 [Metynnis hypsauchen]
MTIKATSPLGDPRVTYNLEEGQVPETNMPVRFYIKPNRRDGSASILVAEPLDYENTRFFTLRVRVQNVAAVPLASFTTVYVNITDVNDNVPFFMSSTYEATVPEGAEIGTSVVQVSASDLDSGPHGKINYIILKDQSGDSQFFSINSYTGVIHTRATFDREQKSSYLIEVQSQDGSESARPGQQGQPNTDTAYVRIFVTDVNDNAPAFSQPVYEISVEEDKEVGYIVITVTANDEDEGLSLSPSSCSTDTHSVAPVYLSETGLDTSPFCPVECASLPVFSPPHQLPRRWTLLACHPRPVQLQDYCA